jgi:formate dehydrogenase iron-sulfur subunit
MPTYPAVAILHDIDKCVRCRGCVVACKKRSNMTPKTTAQYRSYGASSTAGSTVSAQELMVVKSQAYFDMGPMVRYSCWHCYTPTCLDACPYSNALDPANSAIVKLAADSPAHGAVVTKYDKCTPDQGTCTRQCVSACRAGGYPKIQDPVGGASGFSNFYPSAKKMMKCDMCFDRVEAGKTPWCVQTCPADALKFDTLDNITAYMDQQKYASSTLGMRGQVIWASRQNYFVKPKADPYVEDHMSQVVDKLMNGPFARLAIAPVGLALGLYALQKRKEAQVEEAPVG